MILHLREKTAIKMTTSQKYEYKAEGYSKQWDPTTSITAYFTGLNKFRNSLADRGISTSIKEMTMAAGARMWELEMFTEDQMVAWENKPAAQHTWQALQDFFTNVLKGTLSREGKMAEALQKVSSLFTKIAAAKAATTRARDQMHLTAHQPVPLPRVDNMNRPHRKISFQGCQPVPRRLIVT